MTRLGSILLSLVFLAASTGFAVGTHYCHGKAINQTLVLTGTKGSCGDMPEKDDCCDDSVDYYKVDGDYFQSFQNDLEQISASPVILFEEPRRTIYSTTLALCERISHPPPLYECTNRAFLGVYLI